MTSIMKKVFFIGVVLTIISLKSHSNPQSQDFGKPADLPLPSSMPVQDYEKILYRWLMERRYQRLGWRKDKSVRDTGPYLNGVYYGTHPAVRIYYSPQVMRWLVDGRKGDLPDGSIIIKEMFHPPAVLYQNMANNPKYRDPEAYAKFVDDMVFSWTVMVRDTQASTDGWFWANPAAQGKGQSINKAIVSQLDTLTTPPGSTFGAPCLRCHASAESELTFSDLKNIEGFLENEEPIRFIVDTSWRSAEHFSEDNYPLSTLSDDPFVKSHFMLPQALRPFHINAVGEDGGGADHVGSTKHKELSQLSQKPLDKPDPVFVETFNSIKPVAYDSVRKFPSQWMDQVLPASHNTELYITSSNCFGCHGGLGGEPYGVNMFVKTGPEYGEGYNVSEYGEWRWSPMGVAGRDPIFHAQLESEMAYLERDAKMEPSPLKGPLAETKHAVTNTCLSCHGAMGQRQLLADAAVDKSLDPNMSVEYFYLEEQLSSKQKMPPGHRYLKYGQLAREGVSCAVCHHIDKPGEQEVNSWTPPPAWLENEAFRELAYMLFHNTTGRYKEGPADKFFGPFKEVAEKPMLHSLGVEPVFNEFTSDSQLCGTCHTINLPNIGQLEEKFPVLNAAEINPAFKPYQHSIEQATFLEWQNSSFAQNPGGKDSTFRSCQDCHMPGGFETLDKTISIDQITTQIAAIQDVNFPEAENRLPNNDIDIPLRNDYKRHEHVGLNVFLLKMVEQFPDILGLDTVDYMTSANNGATLAIENMIRGAQQFTAEVSVKIESFDNNTLRTKVKLRNLSGHRFPSGVAFRRAFIEFVVLNGDKEIWASGRTNSIGLIVDGDGKVLPTEFLPDAKTFQRHHQIITRQDQVQIYEELNQNAQNEFTTSFIHRVHHPKDNRLLPDGWRKSEYFKKDGEVLYEFMRATDPKCVGDDPDYQDKGTDFKGGDSLIYEVVLPANVKREDISVRATLYSQSIPPSWLHQRFSAAPNGEATRRLYYMASHLNLDDTPMKHWKLKMVSATESLKL